MKRLIVTLLFICLSASVWAQEERVYDFDLLAINYVTPIGVDEAPVKSYTAINSQDNTYHMFLQIDNPSDEVVITMIDIQEGWYSYSKMAWSAFDKVDVTIVLYKRNLNRLRTSKSYPYEFSSNGIRDTVISEKTFKTFTLQWAKKRRELRHLFVIDTTIATEVPIMSEELFSSNLELLEQIPNGRFESVLFYKDGEPLRRIDNLDYVTIAIKLVVK